MKLTLNELKYVLLEASDKLLMEISNNAIETMIKTANPELVPYFNHKLGDICTLKDGEGNFNTLRGGLCPKIGLNPDEGIEYGDMKLKDWLRLNILKQFHINRGNGPLRYLKGIVRICCSNGIRLYDDIEMHPGNQERFRIFKQLIAFMHSHNIDMDEDLNGLNYIQLRNQIYPLVRKEMIKRYAERQGSDVLFNTGEYTVNEIRSFNEASKFGKYTSWCVTQGQSHFDTYTSDGSQFFFCLKNGFENVPREKGENCPLDEYGLSMVSVCVSPSGGPEYITTRWNHDNNGENNSNLRTFKQIENILGIPKNVFLENLNPEIKLDDFKYALENTNLPLDKIFRVVRTDMGIGFTLVGFYDDEKYGSMMYNFLDDRKLLSDEWYIDFRPLDDVFSKGLIQVRTYDGEYNLFDKNGKVFPKNINGYIEGYDVEKGVYKVYLKRYGDIGFNLVNRQCQKLLPTNVKFIGIMNRGYAEVRNENDELNFIDSDYNFVWDKWKSGISLFKEYGRSSFNDGIAVIVMRDSSHNYINIKTGEIILPKSQTRCKPFVRGYGEVKNELDLVNLVNTSGEFLFDKWFMELHVLRNGWFAAKPQGENEFAIIDKEGNIVSDKRWANIFFYDGRYGCVTDGKDIDTYIVIDSNFNEILRTDKLVCFSFPNDTFVVLTLEPSISTNIMTLDGTLLLPDGLKPDSLDTKKQYFFLKDENNIPKYKINNETGEIIEL
jgi:hypothetical protein